MGNAAATAGSGITYAVPLEGTAVPNKRSAIYRSWFNPDKLVDNFTSGQPCQNAWDIFQRGVAAAPDGPCLGTRERLPDGSLGEYRWRTYKETEQLALDVGSGLLALKDAVPVLHFPEEPVMKSLKFLGLYSKNREEWLLCEQACNAYALTIVPLYDTLGPDSATFILSQTHLRTLVTTDECAVKLFDLLEDAKKNSAAATPRETAVSSRTPVCSSSSSDKTAPAAAPQEPKCTEEGGGGAAAAPQEAESTEEKRRGEEATTAKAGTAAAAGEKQEEKEEGQPQQQGGEVKRLEQQEEMAAEGQAAACVKKEEEEAQEQSASGSAAAASAEKEEEETLASSGHSELSRSSNSSSRIDVKYVILMGDEEEAERNRSLREELQQRAAVLGVSLLSWNQLLKLGRENRVVREGEYVATLRSANTICYTSGTTGQPKGVIISHGNVVATVAGAVCGPLTTESLRLYPGDRYLSYLPLAHAYERSLQNILFCIGGAIGFHGGDTTKLLDDVQKLEPTVFASVPRLFCRIHDRVIESVKTKSSLEQAIFRRGLTTKLQKTQITGKPQHAFWDALVFSKTKNLLGSRLRYMLVGSAPLEASIQQKIRAFFAVPLLEGYGMTETMAASFIAQGGDGSSGHVGGCCPSLEFCLFDISHEMPQYRLCDPEAPAGEICIRGPVVTCGYFCNAEETARAIDADGWLHTGDVAVLRLYDGALRIVDRKKNIFKLVQGEYVAPEKIENIYIQAPLVMQIFVFGYSTQYCVVAIVVPDAEQAAKWQKENGMENLSLQQLCEEPKFYAAVEEEMTIAAKRNQLKGFEVVKKFAFELHPFTIDSGLLTPTLKIKRFLAREKYKKEIDRMYAELTNSN